MATIEEIKRVSGPRAKRVPIIGSRVLYGLCNGTLPDGVDYATWRKVTLALAAVMADDVLDGRIVTLPRRMGSISLRRKPRVVKIGDDGKPKVNTPVDWGATVRLWSEDDDARRRKVIVHHDSKNVYSIMYTKNGAAFLYDNRVSFKPVRALKLRLKERLKDGEQDCLLMTHIPEMEDDRR